MSWIDTHAHLHFSQLLPEIDEVLKRAKNNNVTKIITVGINLQDSKDAVNLTNKYDDIYVSVGVHPHDSITFTDDDINKFKNLSNNKKVIAIGEIGLDFYRDHSPKDIQEKVFKKMLLLAKELKLPVIIHNRNATERLLKVLDENFSNSYGGIIHCFDGDTEILNWAIKNNFFISYSGTVTYKSAEKIRASLSYIPLNKLFIETDCPYLSPTPLRGKRNEPANIIYTGQYIANYLNIDISILQEQLKTNFKSLFSL